MSPPGNACSGRRIRPVTDSVEQSLPVRYRGLLLWASIMHSRASREKLLALIVVHDLRAYCDESETPGRAFSIAGYLASATVWDELESEWADALEDESLSEFHMQPCEQGHGEFKGKTQAERRRLQDHFIDLLTGSRIRGFVTAIDLAAYDELRSEVKDLRAPGYWKPYLLAFQHQLEQMALAVDDDGLPAHERIAFSFDEQKELQGRAKTLYDSVKGSRTLSFVGRLGAIAFLDSRESPAVQTADVLAYEARREFSEAVYGEPRKPSRSQWQRLYAGNGGPLVVKHFDGDALAELVDVLRDLGDAPR
jgi:Protein of unknown function (DUF3800)